MLNHEIIPTEIINKDLLYKDDIQEMINAFIDAQDVKESSRMTYRRAIKPYFIWIKDNNLTVSTLVRQDVLNYKRYLINTGLSPLSIGSYLTAVRKFYQWTENEDLFKNIARDIKTPRRKNAFVKQTLKPDQVKDLLSKITDKRNYAILNLMLRTGLRTIEVTTCNISDIIYKHDKRVLQVQSKGKIDKSDFVILSDKAYEPIREYLETRNNSRINEPLFVSASNSTRGNRLSTRTISKIAKRSLIGINLNSRVYSAHSMRHSTAVNLMRSGARLEDVQEVLRHSSPVTTQIYITTIKEEQRLEKATEHKLDDLF